MPARTRAVPDADGDTGLSRSRMIRRVLVLGALTALGPLTIDLYLPAFPDIAGDLGATEAQVQLTLTGTLLGFAVGQLILGPWSDAVGRRRPLIAATLLHVVASLLCAVAPTIEVLGVFRVLQGMAAAAGAVVSMAVVRDLYTGLPAVQLLSRLMLVTGVAPVLAPTLGGQVLQFTDWRGVFWVLAALGLGLVGVVVFGLKETLPEDRRRSGGVADTVRTYGSILRERSFVGLMLTGGLMMAALFGYIAGSSFVFQDVFGLSEQGYGILFGLNSLGLIIATQLNARLVRRVRPQWIVAGALVVASSAAALMLVFAATGALGIYGIAVPLFVILTSVGFTMPNIPVLALAGHSRSAGTAAALLGAMNFVVGAVSAPLVGAFGTGSAVPMAGVMLGMSVLAVAAMFLIARPRHITGLEPDPPITGETPPLVPEPHVAHDAEIAAAGRRRRLGRLSPGRAHRPATAHDTVRDRPARQRPRWQRSGR
ncbi:multidrug effflux MFS transporter [Jiangella mangrovi]|uniref:DHA1 family bicyclomycin/chloramphenicol resistance-like MFS transporter n=1 Tax=Jiangella mangrovi TaxID=1524084 RepID=A0A7W9LK73_9ACTN|nr:multidrug effflux MFS transporter [Jiangella mangrovi]MBB5786806.1 DHA1 family bicyclomycin/chloramphenicol resistance-like MFS transporter [Jiangella mangrovi]